MSIEMTESNVVVCTRWRRARQFVGLLAAALAVVAAVMFVVRAERAMAVLAVLCLVLAVEILLGLNEHRLARKRQAVEAHVDGRGSQGRRMGSSVAVRVFVALAFIGLFVAAITLDAQRLALGALAVFLGVALFGAPAWLAAVSDEESRVGRIR